MINSAQKQQEAAEFLSRPAVRNGDLYCAPWCGGRCTWAAFQQATRRAKALAKKLGPRWKPEVWENLGWFYKVTNGILEVTVSHGNTVTKTSYKAWCQSSPQAISD